MSRNKQETGTAAGQASEIGIEQAREVLAAQPFAVLIEAKLVAIHLIVPANGANLDRANVGFSCSVG